MTRFIGPTIVAMIVVAAVGFGVAVEYALWSECRGDHSVLYCLRVLGR